MTRTPKPSGYTCDCGKVHVATKDWPKWWWVASIEHYCAKCGRTNILTNGKLALPDRFRK